MFINKLLGEQSRAGKSGVDLPELENTPLRTGQKQREHIGLPEVSEPQVVRYFTKLSQTNYAIDTQFYPLGSCTMKHNPRLNEKIARLDGFANLHPLQHTSTTQGALQLMWELEQWLCKLTNLSAATLNPAAGAHGELTGAMIIRKAHEERGNPRHIILIPDNAHGTNPATATMCGYICKTVPSTSEGFVDMQAFEALLNEDVAAFMLTNPSTCGLFEPNAKAIADKLHAVGAYFYSDGANFNAIAGKVRPGDLGVDVMQFNLHKTFSTPHGGGGPGSGPVVVSAQLAPYLPTPQIVRDAQGFHLKDECHHSIGRIRAFHGQFGMMVRALSYMKSYGINGIKQASQDAVLNANYVLHHLKNDYHAPYSAPCMHECLLTHKKQKEKGVTTMDIAKTLIDHGLHPMTVYFPLVVDGAMLIEPTESESLETLEHFISVMKIIAQDVEKNSKEDNEAFYQHAPQNVYRSRLDEVKAARTPKLTSSDS